MYYAIICYTICIISYHIILYDIIVHYMTRPPAPQGQEGLVLTSVRAGPGCPDGSPPKLISVY